MVRLTLTPQQLQAVTNLRGNADFVVFIEAVARHCGIQNEAHIKQPKGDEYLRGQLRAFSDLLEAVNEAPTNLNKAKQPKT